MSLFLCMVLGSVPVSFFYNTCSCLVLPSPLIESEVTQLCPSLCDPLDCSLPGFSVHGIFQTRILEWVAISFSRRSSWPRDWTHLSCIAGRLFTIEPPGKPLHFLHLRPKGKNMKGPIFQENSVNSVLQVQGTCQMTRQESLCPYLFGLRLSVLPDIPHGDKAQD